MRIIFDVKGKDCVLGAENGPDRLVLDVESGNPGGNKQEFIKYIADAISDWYDSDVVAEVDD